MPYLMINVLKHWNQVVWLTERVCNEQVGECGIQKPVQP